MEISNGKLLFHSSWVLVRGAEANATSSQIRILSSFNILISFFITAARRKHVGTYTLEYLPGSE